MMSKLGIKTIDVKNDSEPVQVKVTRFIRVHTPTGDKFMTVDRYNGLKAVGVSLTRCEDE